MITLPAAIVANWRLGAAAVAAALMCSPLTYCAGKRDAEALNAANLIAAAEKVKRAAVIAEFAATLMDGRRRAQSATEIQELQEIVNEAATDDDVGDGMQSLLERLRRRSPGDH